MVTTHTFERYVKQTLKAARVNITTFSAQSVRI